MTFSLLFRLRTCIVLGDCIDADAISRVLFASVSCLSACRQADSVSVEDTLDELHVAFAAAFAPLHHQYALFARPVVCLPLFTRPSLLPMGCSSIP